MERNKDGTFIKGQRYSQATEFKKGTHWREPKPYWNREWLMNEYITKNKSAEQIADENGCITNNILYFLRKHKIKTRTMKEIRASKHWGLNGNINGMFGKTKELNPNWRGGISFEMRELYVSPAWRMLCEKVWERDKNQCQRCFKKADEGMPFHVHHITHKSVTDRLDVSKSILLCKACHSWVHSKKNYNNAFLEVKND